jgi:hypothetical protein
VFNWRGVRVAKASVSKVMDVLNKLLRAPSRLSLRDAISYLLSTTYLVSCQGLLKDGYERSVTREVNRIKLIVNISVPISHI